MSPSFLSPVGSSASASSAKEAFDPMVVANGPLPTALFQPLGAGGAEGGSGGAGVEEVAVRSVYARQHSFGLGTRASVAESESGASASGAAPAQPSASQRRASLVALGLVSPDDAQEAAHWRARCVEAERRAEELVAQVQHMEALLENLRRMYQQSIENVSVASARAGAEAVRRGLAPAPSRPAVASAPAAAQGGGGGSAMSPTARSAGVSAEVTRKEEMVAQLQLQLLGAREELFHMERRCAADLAHQRVRYEEKIKELERALVPLPILRKERDEAVQEREKEVRRVKALLHDTRLETVRVAERKASVLGEANVRLRATVAALRDRLDVLAAGGKSAFERMGQWKSRYLRLARNVRVVGDDRAVQDAELPAVASLLEQIRDAHMGEEETSKDLEYVRFVEAVEDEVRLEAYLEEAQREKEAQAVLEAERRGELPDVREKPISAGRLYRTDVAQDGDKRLHQEVSNLAFERGGRLLPNVRGFGGERTKAVFALADFDKALRLSKDIEAGQPVVLGHDDILAAAAASSSPSPTSPLPLPLSMPSPSAQRPSTALSDAAHAQGTSMEKRVAAAMAAAASQVPPLHSSRRHPSVEEDAKRMLREVAAETGEGVSDSDVAPMARRRGSQVLLQMRRVQGGRVYEVVPEGKGKAKGVKMAGVPEAFEADGVLLDGKFAKMLVSKSNHIRKLEREVLELRKKQEAFRGQAKELEKQLKDRDVAIERLLEFARRHDPNVLRVMATEVQVVRGSSRRGSAVAQQLIESAHTRTVTAASQRRLSASATSTVSTSSNEDEETKRTHPDHSAPSDPHPPSGTSLSRRNSTTPAPALPPTIAPPPPPPRLASPASPSPTSPTSKKVMALIAKDAVRRTMARASISRQLVGELHWELTRDEPFGRRPTADDERRRAEEQAALPPNLYDVEVDVLRDVRGRSAAQLAALTSSLAPGFAKLSRDIRTSHPRLRPQSAVSRP